MASFGCSACIPEVAVKVSQLGLKPVARLIDEPHLGVSISACGACSQQFVSVFAERIDWVNGEDPQCSTLMPLTAEEAARMIAAVNLAELSALGLQRPFLRDDWPAYGARSLEYGTGRLIGPYD